MSNYLIYLKLEPYLAQWLVHEQGGEPVEFNRKSTEFDILRLSLISLPKDAHPDVPSPGSLAIALPHFKYKDVRVYNYLPKKGKAALKRCIRSRFTISLWDDLHRFGYIGKHKQDLVWSWMAANGIEPTETNFFAILKIYQRKREAYRVQKYRENLPDFGHKKKENVTHKL